ncbi:MAG: putative sugar O-methyltransferase [Magnetococcales bacterium]|nr:putative sugar O-methyltransferase [Magnetococcales bacterium]
MAGIIPETHQDAALIMEQLFTHPLSRKSQKQHPNLVEHALDLVETARKLPYPNDLKASPWWQQKQHNFMAFCKRLRSPVDIVSFAQCTYLSGSDRRLFDRTKPIHDIVLKQLRRMAFNLNICPPIHMDIEDSPYSMPPSIVPLNGKNYSNSFLNMLGYALGSSTAIDRPHNHILEIGSGYGNLARILKLRHPNTTITLLDLPETLLLSYIYLTLNFPEATIRFITEGDTYDHSDHADFILLPAQLSPFLQGKQFDLAINTGSLQEMPRRTVDYFMDLVQNQTDTSFFYSFNYFLNARSVLREWSEADRNQEANNICPIMKPNWKPVHFQFNTPHLTVDCTGRNWLELLMKKEDVADSAEVLISKAHAACEEADQYPVFSDEWLKLLWTSIHLKPTSKAIHKLLGGIELFTLGWNRTNHMFSGQFGAPSNPKASLSERRQLFESIEEVRYYRSLLKST